MWWWVLLWAVLVLAAAAVLGWLAWGVVRRGIAVGRELAEASARIGELAAAVEQLPAPAPPRPTVLDGPVAVHRAQRQQAPGGAA